MINEVVGNTLRFIFLVLLQVLILNNIQLSGYLNPFLYVLFILMLPFETPKWLVLERLAPCGRPGSKIGWRVAARMGSATCFSAAGYLVFAHSAEMHSADRAQHRPPAVGRGA